MCNTKKPEPKSMTDLCKMEADEALKWDALPETDDLGVKWGSYSDINTHEVHSDPVLENIQAVARAAEGHFEAGEGKRVSLEAEQAIANEAISRIQASVGNSDKLRYTVLVFEMKNVDPETTAGDIETYSHISTAGDDALITVAENMLLKRVFGERATRAELDI